MMCCACVIAIEPSSCVLSPCHCRREGKREGGKRGAVTDGSVRWHGMLCVHHHHCHVVAVELLCHVSSLCHCHQESKRVRKRGEGVVVDTLQFVEVAGRVRRVKDIKCDGNVSGSEQKQSSKYTPCCPVLAALISRCIPP